MVAESKTQQPDERCKEQWLPPLRLLLTSTGGLTPWLRADRDQLPLHKHSYSEEQGKSIAAHAPVRGKAHERHTKPGTKRTQAGSPALCLDEATQAQHCTMLEIVHIEGACMSWLVQITV
jgi:hypothetical protein